MSSDEFSDSGGEMKQGASSGWPNANRIGKNKWRSIRIANVGVGDGLFIITISTNKNKKKKKNFFFYFFFFFFFSKLSNVLRGMRTDEIIKAANNSVTRFILTHWQPPRVRKTQKQPKKQTDKISNNSQITSEMVMIRKEKENIDKT
jgi:hypothetical protein